MSKYFLSAFLILAILSCGHSNSDKNGHKKSASSAISSLSKMAGAAKKSEKNYKRLANTTPLTNDQLKAWMPEELNGLKRIAYSVGGQGFVKFATLDATFANDDKSKKIELTLMDGADSLAAAAMSLVQMAMASDFEQSDEHEVEKTVTKNGVKAIEKYQKDNSRSSLKFIAKDRYLITLEGTKVDEDGLWKAADELQVDKLE